RFDCDWSSDVCSSDLAGPGPDLAAASQNVDLSAYAAEIDAGTRRLRFASFMVSNGALASATIEELDGAGATLLRMAVPAADAQEIGRASCRERVESGG